MQHTRAILRRAAAQREMKGSVTERDTAIKMFLGELSLLFTPRMIASIDDEIVAEMFEDWVKSLRHLTAEQRIDALIQDVRLCSVPFLVYRKGFHRPKADDKPPVNVVSLHAR